MDKGIKLHHKESRRDCGGGARGRCRWRLHGFGGTGKGQTTDELNTSEALTKHLWPVECGEGRGSWNGDLAHRSCFDADKKVGGGRTESKAEERR